MNLKSIKALGILFIFGLCFLFHYMYDWFPNPIFSIFFPVNESIWEHMKLIYTSFIIYGIIDYLLIKKSNCNYNNFLFQLGFIPILGITIYLLIYLPIYNKIGENMFISIGLLFIIIIIEQIISYYLLNYKELKYQKIFGLLLIIISFICFGYLTYKPTINYLFYDILNNKYGINIYIK